MSSEEDNHKTFSFCPSGNRCNRTVAPFAKHKAPRYWLASAVICVDTASSHESIGKCAFNASGTPLSRSRAPGGMHTTGVGSPSDDNPALRRCQKLFGRLAAHLSKSPHDNIPVEPF